MSSLAIGIAIGIIFMVCLIIAFAAGYGFADQKYTKDKEEEQS